MKVSRVAAVVAALVAGVASVGAQEEAGTWPFNPPKDTFDAKSLVDLRGLNEKVAGEAGFVKRSADGNDFVLGSGKPARFWAVNDGAAGSRKKVDMARHAKWLAKHGINMARVHASLGSEGKGEITDVNRTELDHLWKAVAELKKEGIYTIFSPYWAAASKITPAQGRLESKDCQGLLFFDKTMQDAYKAWMKVALTEKNPYTGVALKDEPALAVIEIQNEDSLLFWTVENLKGPARVELRRQYAEFLKKKYGSLEKALEAWDNAAPPRNEDLADAPEKNEMGLYIIWQMTQNRSGGQNKRLSDQLEFYTATMFNFNKMIGDYFHKELGAKSLVNAGNWRTADNVRLLDAERFSYTANEVMAVNRYYSPFHAGKNNGWAIVNGDTFQDTSCLLAPRDFPIGLKQPDGFPMMVTESSWVPPLGYQSEGPFLIAAYQSLNGVDAYYWFATGEEDWRHPGSANGFLPSEGKWVCATPMIAGQWPAAALMFRKGYIKKGEPAVFETRSKQEMWDRRTPIIAEDPGFDPNRDQGNVAEKSSVKTPANPLAFLVGPVVVKYGPDASGSKVADLKKYIDEDKKVVRSITNELMWDYGNGICALNAPCAQGVTGFVGKTKTFKLADVEINAENDYATILAVSMDGRPLGSSGSILVQVGTTERPTGWRTSEAQAKVGKEMETVLRVDSFGTKPWQIVKAKATLSVRNAGLKSATVLDANGMPTGEIPLENKPGGKTVTLPADALYVVLR